MSASSFNLMISVLGIGGAIGAICVTIVEGLLRPTRMFCAAVLVEGISFGALAFDGQLPEHVRYPALVITCLLLGFAIAIETVGFALVLQKNVRVPVLGRASSASTTIAGACTIVAPLLGVLLAKTVSVEAPFALSGVAMIIVATIGLVVTRTRGASVSTVN